MKRAGPGLSAAPLILATTPDPCDHAVGSLEFGLTALSRAEGRSPLVLTAIAIELLGNRCRVRESSMRLGNKSE